MGKISQLEPKEVFHFFEEICQIPHGSGNVEQISDYLVDFAKARNLEYVQDELKMWSSLRKLRQAMNRRSRSFSRGIWIWLR